MIHLLVWYGSYSKPEACGVQEKTEPGSYLEKEGR
jgi:hypothetical protein